MADKTVPHHVHYGPFHLDYIESDIENALAFEHQGYCFIGLTEPLMNRLFQITYAISHPGVIEIRSILPHPIAAGDLRTVLFRALLFFIATHEYTHPVHGHIAAREALPAFYNEIENHCKDGSPEDQVTEVDADGWAAFLVLNNLINLANRLATESSRCELV